MGRPGVFTVAMEIAITGATGLIGTALTESLRAGGHRVVALTRGTARATGDQIGWDPAKGTIDAASLEGIDAVVHLAGAGIGDHRWTDDYKREIRNSRTVGTALIATTLAALDRKPSVLLSGSAIGWYGDRADEVLTETSAGGSGFLAEVCRDWEAATAPAQATGIRVAHLRTGIVLTPRGGALKKLLPLFKIGAGGRFGKGTQWQSWISLDDEIGAITHLLTADVQGAVNLTAPNPVTNAELSKVLASVLHRPSFLPVPSFGPKLLLGAELADNLLFSGQRVLPEVLQGSGYRFAHPTLEQALRSLLSKPATQ